jgi:NTE family protein
MIEAEAAMMQLGASSKFNGDWGFLTRLRDLGRERAGAWLAANFSAIGKQSTLDIGGLFL